MSNDAGVVIRAARLEDAAAIAAIYAPEVLSGSATFETEPPDAQEMARRQQAITAGGFPYLVAELDGAVAAYAYASAYRTRPAYRFTVEDSIYVARTAQGRGIGGRLLGEIIRLSSLRGYRQMIAVIGDSANQQGSVRLHQAAGFAHAGRLPGVGHKHGRWLDSVLMQRPLGQGEAALPD